VPAYRFFRVGANGHVFGPPEIMDCTDDDEAVEKAQQLVDGFSVEVWDLTRCVARIEMPKGK